LFTFGAELAFTPAFAHATMTDVTHPRGLRETGISCATIGFRGSHPGTERKDWARSVFFLPAVFASTFFRCLSPRKEGHPSVKFFWLMGGRANPLTLHRGKATHLQHCPILPGIFPASNASCPSLCYNRPLDPDDPKWQVRDISRVCYEQVPATHSVKAGSYMLHCPEALSAE
jgi:hypothetical protein